VTIVSDDALHTPFRVPVTGSSPTVTLFAAQPDTVHMPDIHVGYSGVVAVLISDPGSAPLNISDIVVSNPHFWVGRTGFGIAAGENDTVGVVDLDRHQVVHVIAGLKKPQGLGYLPSTDTLYVANGGEGSLDMFRGEDYQAVARIHLGDDADNPGTGVLIVTGTNKSDVIVIEPWRATAFPVVKDLIVDRSAFDRIIAVGGFVSVATGGAPDGNTIPVPKENADLAMDAAACIGCGACVAACPNASASLFVAAKVSQLALLPQGQPERHLRVRKMVAQMDDEGFGNCTNHGECETACPKGIGLSNIARMNRDYIVASLRGDLREAQVEGGAG
jgi:ferredoxin